LKGGKFSGKEAGWSDHRGFGDPLWNVKARPHRKKGVPNWGSEDKKDSQTGKINGGGGGGVFPGKRDVKRTGGPQTVPEGGRGLLGRGALHSARGRGKSCWWKRKGISVEVRHGRKRHGFRGKFMEGRKKKSRTATKSSHV